MTNYIIDLTSAFIWVFAIGVFLRTCWNSYLNWREKTFVLDSEGSAFEKISKLHDCAKNYFSEEKLSKALIYERTSTAFGVFKSKVFQQISFAVLAIGIAPMTLDLLLNTFNFPFFLSVICTVVALSSIDELLQIPFSYYENFKLEEKFGFNTMTLKLFITDFFKNLGISAALNAIQLLAIVFLLVGFHKLFGNLDWKACLILTGISTAGSMLMEWTYMKIILPMFNKLTPMEDSELKMRMVKLMKDFGFNPNGVFILDASKRSRHSNAYCSGWGKNKRLVLFDTLLKNFTDDEIMAILGHELAHSKLHHLVIIRCMEFVQTFIFLLTASFFIYDVQMFQAFGFSFITQENIMTFSIFGFWLFGKLFNSWWWMLEGIESWISQKMEYAADQHSCKYNRTVEPMITSLFKLYDENLSYPLSDPLYEAWNSSHPGLVNRVLALKSLEDNETERKIHED